jgi:protein SCO1/2
VSFFVSPLPHSRRRALLYIAGTVCALFAGIACVLIWRKPAPQPLASILKEVGYDQNLGTQLSLDLVFQDEHGRDVELRDCFKKRPVVLSFVYYECPMLCTQVLDGLVRSLHAMNLEPGDDFDIVTVSIDARDSSEMAAKKKQSYLAEYGNPKAEAAWHFLTAPARSLHARAGAAPTGEAAAQLAKEAGFRYHFDEKIQQFAHASGIVVVTPQGTVSKYFYGIDYSPRDLRLALVEASAGQVGTWMDQALLLCYHYDPLTGAYGVVIMSVIRLFGALTVVFIVALVFVLLRRERRTLQAQAGGS